MRYLCIGLVTEVLYVLDHLIVVEIIVDRDRLIGILG
uniref:Uncharacterized protein n=1 Tax=Arundo donax TaxID=35708 RepID=A0A0A9BYB0_ARUDO